MHIIYILFIPKDSAYFWYIGFFWASFSGRPSSSSSCSNGSTITGLGVLNKRILISLFHKNVHSEKLDADHLFSLKRKILSSKILTLSTKTLLQYTVQTLFLQLALMQIQQCLFLSIYLDHLQSQQLFPLDQTGKKLPPATRWTRRVKDYALKEQQHVWQTEHEAVDPSWGYHPVLPLQFLQEL